MLKKRIVGCVVVKNNWAVQSIDFKSYLPIGRPEIVVEFLNRWGIDEVVVLDIDATSGSKSPNIPLIKKLSSVCLVPLTYGGGISTVVDIRNVIRAGADKVSINTSIRNNLKLISEGSDRFGDQAIVASIDCQKVNGLWKVYNYLSQTNCDHSLKDLISKYQDHGVGELFINSVNDDGKKTGFSGDLFLEICKDSKVPVIACGGAGHPKHFLELFGNTEVSAAAAANFFNFTEHSVILTKAYLKKRNFYVRLETYANYEQSEFNDIGRIKKKTDEQLLSLRFQHIEDEVI